MKTTITTILLFDAAHSLPDHLGKCRNIHGHTYKAEVSVSGPIGEAGPETGMVMDFSRLEEEVKRLVIEPLDHRYLNEVLDFAPTAERIAAWIFDRLSEADLPVRRIRLWETPDTYAEVEA